MAWTDYFQEQGEALLKYAVTNPYQFLYYVLLVLSPLFAISAFLSWKLAKAIQKENKEKKRKARRGANIQKANKRKAD